MEKPSIPILLISGIKQRIKQMSRNVDQMSRSNRRRYTKSAQRKKVQTMTRGAAKRARKSIGF